VNLGTATVLRANARALPIPDDSVDLIVTSPPYFALRSYTDAGEHYAGQIGDEPTPAEFLDSLLAVTRECMRVLKPSGSLWVNLGDKYSDRAGPEWAGSSDRLTGRPPKPRRQSSTAMAPRKSLLGLPWRYALACIDNLGLILREEIIWSKPNGLPESVTDRVRRSHEHWFHLTLNPHYFSAVDEIREQHAPVSVKRAASHRSPAGRRDSEVYSAMPGQTLQLDQSLHPLGRLPGSVWTISTEPLAVPSELGIDHFAAFPTEWPKRIIQGWSPSGVCTACGEGRRPVTSTTHEQYRAAGSTGRPKNQALVGNHQGGRNGVGYPQTVSRTSIDSYACACPEPTAPTTPAVVLDLFGGTGTTAMVAKALGRHGISVDMSADYCRLAQWRTTDRNQLAKVLGVAKTEKPDDHQLDLFAEEPA